MTRSVPVGEVRELGDRALLIGVEDAAAARVLARSLAAAVEASGALGDGGEIVVGLVTIMVALGISGDVEAARAVVARQMGAGEQTQESPEGDGSRTGQLVTIPCRFDGPDLDEVSGLTGCPRSEVVELMTAHPLTVGVMGFSPGFAFLTGLPEVLRRVPRRPRPRPAVPPGSVALANGHAAVYPTASPGGWHLIGRTGQPMFSLSAPPYARLAAGDRVHFTVAGESDRVVPEPLSMPEWTPPEAARHLFDVVSPGLRTVRQDGGRRGVAGIGVPAAGPADPISFALANRLVGNPDEAGALEVTVQGPTLLARAPGYVAVVGGRPEIRLGGQALAAGQVFPVREGQELVIGPVRHGLRTYVAVAGGLLGPILFASCSSDQLCGLGPGPLVAGDALHAGAMTPPLGDHLGGEWADGSGPQAPVVLRVLPGPHAEWFEPDALAALEGARFRVAGESNRVGLRLQAEGALALRAAGRADHELDSQGMVVGALQVPPGGDPVVLMTDHATLGGYPVLAVVATVDHGRLGQCAPGDTVAFRSINHATARRDLAQQRRAIGRGVVGHYPLAVE